MLMSIQSVHPKNGHDVIVAFKDYRLTGVAYADGEDVDLNPMLTSIFQAEIDEVAKAMK
jgi:hypothetical protein